MMKQLIDEEYSKMPRWSINKHHLWLCDIYNKSFNHYRRKCDPLSSQLSNIDKAAYTILE